MYRERKGVWTGHIVRVERQMGFMTSYSAGYTIFFSAERLKFVEYTVSLSWKGLDGFIFALFLASYVQLFSNVRIF
ncbi:MAG: hypothetical protein NPIRA02_11160 [Nitrospirales bacterium]|nr:MAG: hypothetical protein NPIRA02_11160 [Nitrospirales bacterium]